MKKNQLIIGAVCVGFVIIVGGIFVLSSQPKQGQKQSEKKVLENIEAIPTVDASVKVELVGVNSDREVNLSIDAIPNGTASIDYELAYQTKQQGLQGIIGTLTIESGNSVEKKLTLGTCSSGTCIYHQVDGTVKVSLKFNGSYGERLYEKEYSLGSKSE